MRERTLGFVWGYLPYVDRLPKTAKRLGLLQRFSLAFNRYPDSCPGLYEIAFDPEFILGLLDVLLPIFPHDTLTVIDEVGASHPDLVSACRIDPDYGEQESFTSAILHLGGRETCYIEYLAYGRCGGPHPYHDAYVYGVYCKDIERQPIQDALFSYCLESRIPRADIISGSPHPVPKPWYREIIDFIFPI